jgi:hypothetical protein
LYFSWKMMQVRCNQKLSVDNHLRMEDCATSGNRRNRSPTRLAATASTVNPFYTTAGLAGGAGLSAFAPGINATSPSVPYQPTGGAGGAYNGNTVGTKAPAGGGGGAGAANSSGPGNAGENGEANTGGGAGGPSTNGSNLTPAGATGGSGVVIIRYADTFAAASSTTNLSDGYPVVAGGYRVYKWITSGTITF